METVKIPKWLKKGAELRVFDDYTVTHVNGSTGWIQMRSKVGLSCLYRHVSQLGKKMERKRSAKKARR